MATAAEENFENLCSVLKFMQKPYSLRSGVTINYECSIKHWNITTWRTPNGAGGERVLSPSEASLFCSCLATMIDFDRISGKGLNYGIKLVVGPFQRLSDHQKYSVLEEVTKALVTPTTSCPVQTALNEGAIYYVFSWLKQQFFDEPEVGIGFWGKYILEAVADCPEENGEVGGDFFPSADCDDIEKWMDAIEFLADRILWDRDWEMEDIYVNKPPEFYRFTSVIPEYFAPYAGKAKRGARDSLYQFVSSYCP